MWLGKAQQPVTVKNLLFQITVKSTDFSNKVQLSEGQNFCDIHFISQV